MFILKLLRSSPKKQKRIIGQSDRWKMLPKVVGVTTRDSFLV